MRRYHETLGVGPAASAAEIRAAYVRLAKRYHPDRNPQDPQAAEYMQRINEAYAALSGGHHRPPQPSSPERPTSRSRRTFGSRAGIGAQRSRPVDLRHAFDRAVDVDLSSP